MSDYDMTAPAEVFIASQAGNHTGQPRVLWRMTVTDAQSVCSHPSTYGGNWMLCWTTHEVNPKEADPRRYVADDGRFDALLDDLGVTVLASRSLIRSGEVVRHDIPAAESMKQPAAITQLGMFGKEVAS